MKKSKKALKNINQILTNEEMDIHTKMQLLEIKKSIEYGEISYTDGIKNSKISRFYKRYAKEISIWLNLPIDTVKKKLELNEFTEIEHKLILTNVFIDIEESKESENERVY